jgi:4-amino-4-deoxy-L-arabinose transferase-like glycosyltransferase
VSRRRAASAPSPPRGPRGAAAATVAAGAPSFPGPAAILGAAWPGLALAAVLLVPFLGKAHTIDDVTFLLQARHVLHDPLHPTAFDLVADGHAIRLSAAMVSGPLMAWLLAPAAALGGAEWAAHGVQLLLVLAAIVATAALAFRLGRPAREARLAALLLAVTPTVMVLATSSMADVPSMAFAALGIERWLAFRADGRPRQGALAALALAAAALARPHAAALIPAAALALLPARRGGAGPAPASAPARRTGWALALPLVAALALVWLANRLTADPRHLGGDFASRTAARFAWARVRPNLIAWGAHWTLALPLGLAWLLGAGPRAALRPALWAGLAAAALLLGMPGIAREPWALPVVALGIACVADPLLAALGTRDRDLALLAAWLLPALPATGYDQLPAKVLVVSAPAAALLAARWLEGGRTGFRRLAAGAVLAIGVTLGLLIAHADAEFADVARRASREMIAPRVARGERVWAFGNWGFEWYAIQAGARPATWEPPYPAAGDVLIVDAGSLWRDPMGLFPRRTLLGEMRRRSTLGRIMSAGDDTGFWSNHWGLMPWTPKNGEIDWVSAWRIE